MTTERAWVLPCLCKPGAHTEMQRRDFWGYVAHLNEIFLQRPVPLAAEPIRAWPLTDYLRRTTEDAG